MNTILAERPAKVLEAIIREYIRTAEPVGSIAVAGRYHLDASPATIRNDMVDLEEAGFIAQPHTSAGRVPTERAYQYYVAHFLRTQTPPRREVQELQALRAMTNELREFARLTAKAVAEFSAESAFMTFGKHDLYYTGLANLFSQPEFAERQEAITMSEVIDGLDEAMGELFEATNDDVQVLIGSRNPIGRSCTVIVTRYEVPELGEGIFGLLGPTRMDYDRNVAWVRYVKNGIQQ